MTYKVSHLKFIGLLILYVMHLKNATCLPNGLMRTCAVKLSLYTLVFCSSLHICWEVQVLLSSQFTMFAISCSGALMTHHVVSIHLSLWYKINQLSFVAPGPLVTCVQINISEFLSHWIWILFTNCMIYLRVVENILVIEQLFIALSINEIMVSIVMYFKFFVR
jgi:hypothetical protein